MGKHTDAKIKYDYVMRYLEGESPTKLGLEIVEKGLSNVDINNSQKMRSIIYSWKKQYYGLGLENRSGLKATGRSKKKKEKNYEEMTREELIEEIKINNAIREEMEKLIKETKKSLYRIVDKLKYSFSITCLCKKLYISTSGYYKWLKNGKPLHGKYNPILVDAIQTTYDKYKGNYGYPRIHIALQRDLGIVVNINTIRRYMKHLKLKAKIRIKRKNRERKNLHTNIPNLIARDFKSKELNQKWYTDVSYIQLKDRWAYCSAIIDGSNNELVDIKLSIHNDNELVMNNMKEAIKNKDVSNLIIHSDHGSLYSGISFNKLLNDNNIKQSMSRVGNSLDNRPIEYFFSILKQEYLRTIKLRDRSFDKINKELEYIKWDYNNNRFQSNLQNKTPCEYMAL